VALRPWGAAPAADGTASAALTVGPPRTSLDRTAGRPSPPGTSAVHELPVATISAHIGQTVQPPSSIMDISA